MRAELPWNVAGIPPEAREAARAAARREGLSVGEWLTRRILRSLSDMGEEPMPFDQNTLERASLDSWGLPQSGASRRETEEVVSRVSRTDIEGAESYRRIEDQLRSVGRRLDNAERSQSESHRVMSQATSEINVASREQSQAFDQLGGQVLGLSERLERLERHVAQDPLKDAVKGLHQGLSRLADQIGQTASHSATQISSVAANLEQLAARLGQARADAETATEALEIRVASVESAVKDASGALEKADSAAKALETRVVQAENTLQETGATLSEAREKIDAHASIRAHDLAELQKWEANHLGSLERIEERIARLETKGPDPAIERRLDNIEQALAGVVSRLEQSDPTAAIAGTLRQVTERLDAVEKSHFEMLAELRASLGRAPEPAPTVTVPSFDPEPAPPAFEPPQFGQSAFEKPASEPPSFPSAKEPSPFTTSMPGFEAPAFEGPTFKDLALETPPFAHPPMSDPAPDSLPPLQEGFAPQAEAFQTDAFEHETGGFAEDAFADHFDMPQDFANAMAQSAPAGENFLSAARRSAQAAADAEAHRSGRGFSWGRASGDTEEKSSPRYLVILVIGFIALLAVAVGLMLSQRGTRNTASVTPALPKTAAVKASAAKPAAQTARQAAQTNAAPAAKPSSPAEPVPTTLALVPSTQPKSAQPPATAQKPTAPAAKPVALASKPASSSADKVAAAANQGNAAAETIIGLRYLDGQGIPADATQALKWLQRAADAGQAVAQYRLGTMYERGQGVTANPILAAKWYLAAANQGNRKAMHNLAVSYAEGAAGKKDMAESARWFSKAAALGLSDSQFNLAVLYERGDGVPQSLIDAYKWYSIAAAAGDAESRTRLSVLQTQLSETDRAAAVRAAQSFRVAPLNRVANVPPEAADIASN